MIATISVRLNRVQKILLILVGGFIALFVLPFSAWLVADEGFTRTARADFCMTCHSMQPMVASYLEDEHGGNTPYGVQAACADCHLDHRNSAIYFFSKARTGIHDIIVETFGDPESIDWEAKREHRETFVYDTGCLNCHNRLQEATMGSNKAFVAHQDYFAQRIDDKCVTCHKHVGHKDLGLYIKQ
ncbi:MAG: cytochrome C [Caldilineae bacterium]|nr:MAG: cytochrome C [Caldilineae bacterium]